MNLLGTRRGRIALFTLLYASEGAPIGFIWWMLPVHLRTSGHPVEQITALTALLVLPWSLKFLWAPAVDLLRTRRWTLRSWIIAAQSVMALSLLMLPAAAESGALAPLLAVLLLHTVAAATQDVAIDALCIRSAPAGELPVLNGWMQAGMMSGRALFGGGSILLLSGSGLSLAAPLLALFILITSSAVWFALPAGSGAEGSGASLRSLLSHLFAPEHRTGILYALLFALTGGAAYEGVGVLAGAWMVDSGIAPDRIGLFFSFFSVLGLVAGSLSGGYLARRFGVYRLIFISAAANAWLAFLLALLPSGTEYMRLSSLTLLYIGIGFFTASSYAMFMRHTPPAASALLFSTFMGATNLCEALTGAAAGHIAGSAGYPAAFLFGGAVTLFSLFLLSPLRRSDPYGDDGPGAPPPSL